MALEFDYEVDGEKVMRAFYRATFLTAQELWRVRAVYIDPHELVADDQEGALWRVPFIVGWNHSVVFAEPKEVDGSA